MHYARLGWNQFGCEILQQPKCHAKAANLIVYASIFLHSCLLPPFCGFSRLCSIWTQTGVQIPNVKISYSIRNTKYDVRFQTNLVETDLLFCAYSIRGFAKLGIMTMSQNWVDWVD